MTDANGIPICRFCNKHGVLIRGIHRQCEWLEAKARAQKRKAMPGYDPAHRQPARPPKPKNSQKFRPELSKPKEPPPAPTVTVPLALPPKAPQVWGRRNKYGMDGWD